MLKLEINSARPSPQICRVSRRVLQRGSSRSSQWLGLQLIIASLGFWLAGCGISTADSLTVDSMRSTPTPNAVEQLAQTPTVQEDLAQMLPITAEAEIGEQVIQLEVARTAQQQQQGLMYRPALPDNRGMLFPFDPPRPVQFWMRNTPQPLDMVFLLDGEVKAVIANVPPCSTYPCPTYGPDAIVNQVIELRSGRAAELGLKVGDQIKIRPLEPQNTQP